MDIVNPYFKVDKDNNIFNIRQKEYDTIIDVVTEMLKPVEDLGFTVSDLRLKDHKFSSGDLSKTIKKNLIIKLQKGNATIDLSMQIPKLIDGNYIIINGRKKIPLFQLFDVPIVTRGKSIKITTNVATILILEGNSENEPNIKISFLGRKVSLALLMFAYYGPQEVDNMFGLSTLSISGEALIDKLMIDLKMFHEASSGYTQDDFINELGRIYSKYDAQSKGEDIIYAVEIIPKIDVMTSRLFHTNTLLEEILFAIRMRNCDDTDFTNKRIRCIEYIIFNKVAKAIFDLCISNRSSRQPKFNINSTQILKDCNVSDIIQFDFAINPMDELTKLSRTSLVGPGGFNRDNVPKHLRDISPSMFGRMCPVDTPDRDNCGILQNLLPNTKLDENNKFTDDIIERAPISMTVAMTPFLEHDDQTRLQMASSQMRQAIMLKDFDKPMIYSGCEGLYTDYTHFVKRAKKDGEVTYLDNKYLIVIYDDKDFDIFDVSFRKIYVENMDFISVNVKPGDKFKKGDILAESNFCTDGKINIGKNLLTAVMVYYGHNYEDGIVISDRLVEEDLFTSVHYKDLSFTLPPNKVLLSLDPNSKKFKPLPEIMEVIKIQQPYAIMKGVPTEIDYGSLFEENIELTTDKVVTITDIDIYPNQWNDDIPEFKEWIDEKIEDQKKKEITFKKIIFDNLPEDKADIFIRDHNLSKMDHVGKYQLKHELVNGIRFDVFGFYFRKVQVGDKMASRHANKGIIAAIIPHEKMPQLEDGRHMDVCINPLGIISRMNIGQLYELHLAMSLYDLKQQLLKMLDEKISQDKIKEHLINYIKIVDVTKDEWLSTQFIEQLPDDLDKDFVEQLTLIQPPFESVKPDDLKAALKYTNSSFDYKLYDPYSKMHIINKVAVGYMNFFRIVHIAEERLAARGIGSYSRKTLQPLGGRKNRGGQRCGEMETACLIAHDAPINLFEFLTTKSDCIDLKNRYIREIIDTELIKEPSEDNILPESVKLFNAYLKVAGLDKD